MNRALAGELVDCLALAGSSEEHIRQLHRFSLRDWESLLPWLDRGGIALAFWDRLTSLGAEDAIPREAGRRLARNLADHRLRVAAMTREFASINRLWEGAGIEYAVLKGFALIPEYCFDAALRPSYDYDYLLSEGALDPAQKVLEAAGYARKIDGVKHHVTYLCPAPAPPFPPSRDGLYAATLWRKVELHTRIWDTDAFRVPLCVPLRPLDRRHFRAWKGLHFYALSEEDALLFQVLHTFQHILHNWCRLGWLLEIARFIELRSTDASFWKKFYVHLEGNDPLTEVVALVLSLAARLFRATLPALVKSQILGSMRGPVSLWVERYGLHSALDNFSENKYTLFLYREFVRDENVWRQIRRSRLLPLHHPNRIAGAATSATSAPLPGSWKQAWYVVERLIHHSVSGAGYTWESARWERLRRLSAARALPSG